MANQDDVDFQPGRSPARVWLAILLGGVVAVGGFRLDAELLATSRETPNWIPHAPPPPPMSQISVGSTPVGAKVYRNDGGVALATTPGIVSLMPGAHSLRFELPGLPVVSPPHLAARAVRDRLESRP